MGIGRKLKVFFKENNLKQTQVAAEIKESPIQLNLVLNDKRTPSFEMLVKLIDTYKNLNVTSLFRDEDVSKITVSEPDIAYNNDSKVQEHLTNIEEELRKLKQCLSHK
jgi:transcriptional regulator with XRE-family HTH domain